MERLQELLNETGLFVELDNNQFRGNSCNVRSWFVFRIWVNKRGHLTIKSQRTQRSFKEWETLKQFKQILRSYELI